MEVFPKSVLQYGTTDPLPQSRMLRAGPLQMLYENGFLRYIKLGGKEIIRMIYFALRDQHWGTCQPQVTDECLSVRADSFDIRYTCHYKGHEEAIFRWQVSLQGQPDGTITFRIEGEALQPFLKNRSGFCVLHPVRECAGQPLRVTEPDGKITSTVFPVLISPQRPFPYLKAMQWAVAEGCKATLRFSGDVFETEDHRNWTDTSYKTFCTPLELPYPVGLSPGDKVQQHTELIFEGLSAPGRETGSERVMITVHQDGKLPLPAIGSSQSPENIPLTNKALKWIQSLCLAHYRADLFLNTPGWTFALAKAARELSALGAPLELVLHFSENFASECGALLRETQKFTLQVRSILLLSHRAHATAPDLVAGVRAALRQAFPGSLIGAGTNYNFAELNRNHFPGEGLDFVSYAIHPQEHAFDNLSLVENLESQADTVRTARSIYPQVRVHVSPVTLRRRFNPYAQDPAALNLSPANQADPRQLSLFGAGWTLGSIKYLAEAGAASLTYYQVQGVLGLMQPVAPPKVLHPLLQEEFVYPVYLVLILIQAFHGGAVIPSAATDPLAVSSLLLEKNGVRRWLIVNHRAVESVFHLPISKQIAWVRKLDETNVLEAMQRPEHFLQRPGEQVTTAEDLSLSVLPYGIAIVDTREAG